MSADYPGDGLREVKYRWPIADILEAHHALDAVEEMRKVAEAKAKEDAKRAGKK